MEISEHVQDVVKRRGQEDTKEEKELLLSYLQELLYVEAYLWGATLDEIHKDEEMMSEETNHLIHYLHQDIDMVEDELYQKELQEFIDDIEKLRNDIIYLKNKIVHKDKLRELINSYTLKLTTKQNYSELEELYFLERQLYEVVEIQEKEILQLIVEVSEIEHVDPNQKLKAIITILKRTREILSGHLEHHEFWSEERKAFSNASNVLHAMITRVNQLP